MASKTQTTMPKRGQTRPAPTWAQELEIKYQSAIAHAFLLHGNVQDYVAGLPGQSLKRYLVASFGKRDIIVTWNRATGFWLPTAEMRSRFAELVEFPVPNAAPLSSGRSGGIAAGLNQLSASAPPTDLAKALEKVRQPADALDYLTRLLRARSNKPSKAAIIIDYAESIAPASEAAGAEQDRAALVTLAEWGRDVTIGEKEHMVILIANELHDLNERLRKSAARWEQIAIPFPTFQERCEFLHRLIEEDSDLGVRLADGLSYEDVARLTTGLRYIDLEDIALRASFHQTDITRDLVKQRKDEILATEFEEVLQVAENEFGFESLGGMEEVKRDLRETVIEPMRSGHHRVVPQGLLLMGPAGTGKTRLARALAKEAGVTFVELQPSKIFSKWVGDTERRLERALTAIIGMAPAIVFIDEIDQAVSRGESGDNGVSNRVFKRLMEIMSDTALRGKVLWCCASNRADLLDAALLRPGRLDKKIPILAPDAAERAAILEVLVKQAFGTEADLPSPAEYQELAAQMDNYTGAEIEGVIGKAVQLRARTPQMSLAQALQTAYERIIPTTQNIEYMTRLALLHCNDLDLVPEQYRELARQLRHPAARAELLAEQEQEDLPQRRARRRDW